LRAGELDFECALHREVARATAKPSRAAELAEMLRGRRTVRDAERRGGEAWRALLGDSVHGNVNKRHGWPPHLLARLRGSFLMAERRRRRRSAATASLGFRRRCTGQLGFGRGTLGGGGAAKIDRGTDLGAWAKQGRRGGGGLGWRRGRTRLSPAWTRRRVGDDRWGPPVIGCERGRGCNGLAAAVWAGWAALRCWVATTLLLGYCWASYCTGLKSKRS
jgi:hypothetical protein